MKKFFVFLLLASLSLSLFSCSDKKSYKDSVPCAEILDTACEQLPINLGYEDFGSEHIKYNFKDTAAFDDKAIRYSVLSEDINELGIFHARGENEKKELVSLAEDYLNDLRQNKASFISSYAKEELPKLQNAEVRSFGNYVAYAILSDKDRQVFFEEIEKAL